MALKRNAIVHQIVFVHDAVWAFSPDQIFCHGLPRRVIAGLPICAIAVAAIMLENEQARAASEINLLPELWLLHDAKVDKVRRFAARPFTFLP